MEVVRDGDGLKDGFVLCGGTLVEMHDASSVFWGFGSGKVGKLLSLQGKAQQVINTKGKPSGICVDSAGSVFVSDVEHGGVLRVDEAKGRCSVIVQDYEGVPLLGPSSIVADGDDTIFFSDSGPLGETTLERPQGSIFAISNNENGQVLRPIALRCLAHPCGLCVSPRNANIVYVCEMLRNRILRVLKTSFGTYIVSILHQFSGRLGPSAISCDADTEHLYVARFDLDRRANAMVSVIDPDAGGVLRNIAIPELKGAQISDLVLNSETGELFIFEESTKKTVKIPISE